MPQEVSRGHSTVREPGAERRPPKHETGTTRWTGRAELVGWHPTKRRTSEPMIPEWARFFGECLCVGKHGMPGVWSSDHAVRWGEILIARSEPPYADPHVRWCGTRGWLGDPQSVTGTRLDHHFSACFESLFRVISSPTWSREPLPRLLTWSHAD